MSLEAGSLDKRIQILEAVNFQDPVTGVVTEVLEPFGPQIWANIRYQTGREYMSGGIDQAKAKISIRIRYRPGVKPSMKIQHGEMRYNIESVLRDNEGGNEYLVLPCNEVQDG